MPVQTDIFTGVNLCSHPSCQWETEGGWSGIEAKYEDKEGNPACYSHRKQGKEAE